MPARAVLWTRTLTVLGAVALLCTLGLAVAGVGPDSTVGQLLWVGLGIAPLFALGAYVAYRRPGHPQARRLLLVGSLLAISEMLGYALHAIPADGFSLWWTVLNTLYLCCINLVVAGITAIVALYPNGTGERAWQAAVVRVMWWIAGLLPLLMLLVRERLVVIYWLASPQDAPPNPLALPWLAWLGAPAEFLIQTSLLAVVGPVVLLIRYLQAGGELRRQVRPLLIVMAVGVFGLLVDIALRAAGIYSPFLMAWYLLISLAIPITIALGIVQFRLFDLDLVIRRSAVYAVLSLAIAAVYVALAVTPGLAFGRSIPVEIAVLLTIAAAIAFHPVRRRLNALADRWVFGERINRYRLLTDFGADLDRSVQLDDLLPTLAHTVARGLRSSWVRVVLRGTGGDVWLDTPVGTAGIPTGTAQLVQSLERTGEVVGRIECGPAPEPYTAADRELLATLAGQAATAIANARLTVQLGERLGELERSRSRIVSAQDAERRRIERDIHDGVQQEVVALIMKMGLARSRIARGDASADAAIADLQSDAGDLLSDLRELARGIRPAVLSDRGLVAAVEARVAKIPLPVQVRSERALRDRRLGADVEAAAYFLVCEALTNAAKHSAASTVLVDLSIADHSLLVSVRDNGAGVASTSDRGMDAVNGVAALGANGGGAGLINLRDRVEALGGTLTVDRPDDGGTDLRARLPLSQEQL